MKIFFFLSFFFFKSEPRVQAVEQLLSHRGQEREKKRKEKGERLSGKAKSLSWMYVFLGENKAAPQLFHLHPRANLQEQAAYLVICPKEDKASKADSRDPRDQASKQPENREQEARVT